MAVVAAIDQGLALGARWGTRFAADYRNRTGRSDKTGEIDVLLGLFVEGLPAARNALRGTFAALGLSLRMGWVYCHQSPIVGWTDKLGNRHGCELGDLLIVVRSSIGGRVSRRALLIQFKISGGTYGLTNHQGLLYTEWPPFRYTSPSRPTWRRSVHPKKPHRGAQVGLIVRCPRCREPHGDMRADIPHGSSASLAGEVAALLLGGGGRELRELASVRRTQGWDRVVWDLLNETTAAMLRYHGYMTTRRDLDGLQLQAMSRFGVAFAAVPDGMPTVMTEVRPPTKEILSVERFDEGPPEGLPRARLDQPPSGSISTVFFDLADDVRD